jgi:hypothetical protein
MSPDASLILARIRQTARAYLCAAVDAALGTLPAEIAELMAASMSPVEVRLLQEALAAARSHRAAITMGFERGLLAAFDRKVEPQEKAAEDAPLTLEQLTLVDDAAIELEIALGRLVQKTVDEVDGEQEAALAARLGVLLGGGPLVGSANPLGPHSALEALEAACRAAPVDGAPRLALVNALQPHLALALRRLYPTLNRTLVDAGVLPRVRHEVRRAPDAADASRPRGRATAAGNGGDNDLTIDLTRSQVMALRELLPGATGARVDFSAIVDGLRQRPEAARDGARLLGRPEGMLFARAMATPVHPEVLAQLSGLQALVAAGSGAGPDLGVAARAMARAPERHPLDDLTAELVAVVFDFLLADGALPATVKVELGRLRIVALKAALLDRSFFARREHPLRKLLTAIVDAGTDPNVEAAPDGLFADGLRQIVGDVLAHFAEDLAVFTTAYEKLVALATASAAEAWHAAESLAESLAREERLAQMQTRAREDVARRTGTTVAPPFVHRFLGETWWRVVAAAEASPAVPGERETCLAHVDDLLWSVAPKVAADVPRLGALLPRLVPALVTGMAGIGIPEAERGAFLDELMRTHTALLASARGRQIATTAPAPASVPPAALEPVATPPLDLLAPMPVLERGDVVELADSEPPVRARLSWISPTGTHFLFTAHDAPARHFAASQLRTLVRNGQLRILPGGPSVEGALASLSGATPSG